MVVFWGHASFLSFNWLSGTPIQLGQGVLVQVSPSLVKRQKTHFHNMTCGASIILGNNGYVWLYPTPGQQDEEAGGYYTSMEVGAGSQPFEMGWGGGGGGYIQG